MVTWILVDQAKVQAHDVFSQQDTYSVNGKTFDAKELEKVFRTDKYKEYSVGDIKERDLVEWFLKDRSIDCTVEEYLDMFKRSIVAIDGMDEILASLSKQYRLASAINEGSEWARYKFEMTGFGDYFEKHVISGDIELEKPAAAFYEKTLEIVSAPASECLFIDDREKNIIGAENVGIDSILFTDAEQLRRELTRYGITV